MIFRNVNIEALNEGGGVHSVLREGVSRGKKKCMRSSVNRKRDTWRLVIQSLLLLSTFFVAYGSKYEIINAVVGLHFVHVVTIALVSMNDTTDQNVRKTIGDYFLTYCTINVSVDSLALVLVAIRTALASRLNIYLTLDQLVYIILYVVHVVALVSIDIYNLMHPLSKKLGGTLDTFFNRPNDDIESSVSVASDIPDVPAGAHLQIRIPPLRMTPGLRRR